MPKNAFQEREKQTPISPAASKHALVLTVANLIESIGVYREKIRGDNQLFINAPARKSELIKFLDKLSNDLELLIKIIDTGNENYTEIENWREQYWTTTKREIEKYVSPENLAKSTVPSAIVFGASAIGFLIGGGAVGAAAGTYVGSTIVGHAKPKDVTEKAIESLDSVE